MAFTEDLGEWFDTDQGFAVDATWNGTTPVVGNFNNEYAEPFEGVESSAPMFEAAAATMPGVAQGDTLEIDGTTYVVTGVQPDGYGIVLLELQAQ